MKLASYRVRGRDSFGAVVGEGVIDLKPRLSPRYASVLDLLRAGRRSTPPATRCAAFAPICRLRGGVAAAGAGS